MRDSEHPPDQSFSEYLSSACYAPDTALEPENSGMDTKDKDPALTELPFWWRGATTEEVINVVQKKKQGKGARE